MKQTLLLTFLILLASIGKTQNIDSLLAEPQTIELTISTPQPRLKETFQISLDINHLRANIFKSLAGKVQLSNDISTTDNGELTMNVNAVKKGKNEIGPLEFYLDKTKYTTNKIIFEVIDALPNTDKGIWFRKVMTSDTSFCIIVEQRIPANSKTTKKPDNSITFTTEPEYTDILKFKDGYSIDGLSGGNSHSATNFSSVTINGEDRQFMYGYSVYYFTIEDRKAKIKITKNKFQNIPDDYKFEDIVIQ
ncbi:MAG: hypothetical protein JNK27_06955 [Chitinophagaceae bacterium]|nr:hypothetical protein [Chitinophagaceae bacterium]